MELHLPWLELSIVIPMIGALWVSRLRDPDRAHQHSIVVCGLALGCTLGAWLDFRSLQALEAHDRWDLASDVIGAQSLVIDRLSAPLLPLAALLYLMTAIATLRAKARSFSFGWTLVSEAILLATLSCKQPWGVVVLLALGTVPPFMELHSRGKPTGVYLSHMGLFVALIVAGWALVAVEGVGERHSILGVALLLAAALVRSGLVPLHCWMTDLFEHASFGSALLFVTPMVGAYAAVRLVLPIAPDWALRSIAMISLVTAVYAAGMALVQTEARRFFCYLFLSHSALVLVGLESVSPVALTGALCLWLSIGLALTGFGLTLRAIETRIGRVSLSGYHGLYEHTPPLPAFFLLTGLASVGFPGTFGFVGSEMLVDGAVHVYPYVGVAVGLAAALNGIAVVKAYFHIFTGTHHGSSVPLKGQWRIRLTVLALALLILGGGLFPQPGVASRHRAAVEILAERKAQSAPKTIVRESDPAARVAELR